MDIVDLQLLFESLGDRSAEPVMEGGVRHRLSALGAVSGLNRGFLHGAFAVRAAAGVAAAKAALPEGLLDRVCSGSSLPHFAVDPFRLAGFHGCGGRLLLLLRFDDGLLDHLSAPLRNALLLARF